MFTWYKNQIAQYGFASATKLFFRAYGSRAITIIANKTLPPKFACPCCGWRGRRFAKYIGYENQTAVTECPRCNSHARHRAFYLWLKNDFQLGEKSGTALICAPEKALEPLWRSTPRLRLIKSDIEPSRQVDVLADLQQIPFEDNSFDVIWCHHIIEQIKDDHAAIRELRRVLRSQTGRLVISSGMIEAAETLEYGFSNPEIYGNWRAYGQDYPQRLAQNGLTVQAVEYRFTASDCLLYGINSSEKVYLCSKNDAV